MLGLNKWDGKEELSGTKTTVQMLNNMFYETLTYIRSKYYTVRLSFYLQTTAITNSHISYCKSPGAPGGPTSPISPTPLSPFSPRGPCGPTERDYLF